ncbi:MAG: aldo/keto reductase [Lentisphaerae bacterium]|jgi:uncharacterized protein|nr:aldo/keto reductase [Lentisphaerota bacterium]MBT4814756.1 aldo/keto reductase [Lentisphaerota bacterium]MBT5606148.1 aldo/keto reductase [Lentisphaerota bacterium]MBT7056367.1 aldo/keto reductase [Lentisphaerota bacterium]MBT7842957.1 aldo/keto reductase [Lentisphaerota bacterium]
MNYRNFGRLDFQVSALGFGCMRLPVIDGDMNNIDEALAIDMIRYGIDHGVNYIDTAYPYHGGNSERVLGKALKGGYREKVKVATKLPTWAVHEPADFDRLLEEQLERLQLDAVDVYLLHNLKTTNWSKLCDLGVRSWLDRILAEGKTDHVGFSYHDHFELFTAIIGGYDNWAMAQIQYNYVNEEVQAGTKGLEYAADQGLAVVIMEPLLGGCLATPSTSAQVVFDASGSKRTPADWALQWLWNKPEVSTVLSGMSTMRHVVENVASAGRSEVGGFSDSDLQVIADVAREYNSLNVIPCTGCGYCTPCPTGVDIPQNFQLYNDTVVFGGNQATLNRNLYSGMPTEAKANACVACGKCEDKCPQKIAIREWLPKVHKQFTNA